jgi:hypothetical protein
MPLILHPPGSQESLPERLTELGRTRKRVAVFGGFFTFIAVTFGAVAVAGVMDVLFHLSPLVRALELVAILITGGVLWLRGISRPIAIRTDPLSVALELEGRYPTLNDALASAVTFLGEDGERLGVSNRLQGVVVRAAQRLVDRHEFGRLIPSGSCWRSGWLCVIVLAAMVPLVLVNSGRAYTSLKRLADPFGGHQWPTKTIIDILIPEKLPTRVPRGEPFDLKFAVRGVIKESAIVEFRLNSGEEFQEQYPLTVTSEAKYTAFVTTRIDPGRLPDSFTFRVISNDYETPWQTVDVAPPPRLVNLEGRPSPRYHVTPPAYTGLPGIDLPDGAAVLEIPVGAWVRMRAAADRRLVSASLSFIGDRSFTELAAPLAMLGHINPFAAALCGPLAENIGGDIAFTLNDDGRILSATFEPGMSGKYMLKLNDETGLTGTRLIEIRLIPDPAPNVNLFRPATGKDPSILTPAASIPVLITAEDKLYALRSVFVEYRVGRAGSIRTISLNDFRIATQLLPAVVGGMGTTALVRPGNAEAKLLLPIRAFLRDDGTPVRDGDTLIIVGAADDWDDVTVLKEPGRSREVEIQIASSETIEAWLQQELAAMRPELYRLRDQQREGRQKTTEAIPLPDGTLTPIDRDKLLTAEQIQRQIRGKVTDPRDGLLAKSEVLRETVRVNKLPRSNTTSRVEAVADEIVRISERDLNPIEANLADARQVGGEPARMAHEQVVPEYLKKALRHQKAVEDGLTNLLDLLAIWGGAAEVRAESRALRDKVNRQIEENGKLAEKIPNGKLLDLLPAEQKADLERAGGRAEMAAEQAASILTRAGRLATEKDSRAKEDNAAADLKIAQSQAVQSKADALPQGMPEKSVLTAKAKTLKAEAEDLKAGAGKSAAEAAALRKGIEAAGGQTLTDDLHKSADDIRNNRQADAAAAQRSAANRLGNLIDSLTEKATDSAPDLAKLKGLADELNAIANAQEDLRKRAAEAAKIADPARREAELRKLSLEQEQLIERGKDVLQRLARERADAPARDTRAALDQMETSRDDLEKGKAGSRSQDEAIEKLDTARDRIDAATNTAPQQLSDEKRRKLTDLVKALSERQKAAVVEANRIHGVVAGNKKWERPLLSSYADLEDRERVIAAEVKTLGEKEFAPLPVLARLLTESATAMVAAADKAGNRREEALNADPALAFDADLEAANDRKVKRPMALAARRLEQLLAVLKEDAPKAPKQKQNTQAGGTDPGSSQPMPGGGGDQEIIPPLAQLKVLELLQAELNQRTEEFAKEHPNRDKLTEEEQAELKELEQAQRDIASLFEQMAKLFHEKEKPKQEKPANEPEKKP